MPPASKYEKKNMLAALNEDSDDIYQQERVVKTKKKEPIAKDKFKKPQRVNKKDLWQ